MMIFRWPQKTFFFRNSLLPIAVLALMGAGCSQVDTTPVIYASLASSGQQLNVGEAQNLINAYRQENGLAHLQVDQRLMAEAGSHAADMARQDKTGHNVSGRGSFAKRMKQIGFVNVKAGENVGAGYHTVAQAFSGWRGSPAHNDNMLLDEARLMGIAAVFAPHSKYKVFWVLIVAADKTGP